MFLSKERSKEELGAIKSYNEAYDLYNRGSYGEALPIFKSLVLSYSQSKDIWHAYASCLQSVKNYEEALKAWAIVALFDGKDPYPHLHAAECYLGLQQYEEMLKAFETLKTIPGALDDRFLKERIEKLLV